MIIKNILNIIQFLVKLILDIYMTVRSVAFRKLAKKISFVRSRGRTNHCRRIITRELTQYTNSRVSRGS